VTLFELALCILFATIILAEAFEFPLWLAALIATGFFALIWVSSLLGALPGFRE
jgi:hypothetical protein